MKDNTVIRRYGYSKMIRQEENLRKRIAEAQAAIRQRKTVETLRASLADLELEFNTGSCYVTVTATSLDGNPSDNSE